MPKPGQCIGKRCAHPAAPHHHNPHLTSFR
jgi:hypothetical protein